MKFSPPQSYVIHDAVGRIVTTINLPPELLRYQDIPEGGGVLEAAKESWQTHFVLDGRILEKPSRPSGNHEFDYLLKQWVDPRSIELLKEAKWLEIKVARDAHQLGGFDWEGHRFDSDEVSQSRIDRAAREAFLNDRIGLDFTRQWTLADNSTVELNAGQMMNVASAMELHLAQAHQKSQELRSQLESVQSAEELAAIVW